MLRAGVQQVRWLTGMDHELVHAATTVTATSIATSIAASAASTTVAATAVPSAA